MGSGEQVRMAQHHYLDDQYPRQDVHERRVLDGHKEHAERKGTFTHTCDGHRAGTNKERARKEGERVEGYTERKVRTREGLL